MGTAHTESAAITIAIVKTHGQVWDADWTESFIISSESNNSRIG